MWRDNKFEECECITAKRTKRNTSHTVCVSPVSMNPPLAHYWDESIQWYAATTAQVQLQYRLREISVCQISSHTLPTFSCLFF